ncbi:unnamed protein product [Rodentolepis nana]|uniref:Uncharacterized protein n=1 Tax=Rodentolepis nana TaxID=102285 RepID=A0A158QJF1_RODNA|nr:unnamed protein product [Rodentolepis nana]
MLEFDFNKNDNTITVKRANFEESLQAISDGDNVVGFYECHFKTIIDHGIICVRSEAEYLLADTKYYTSLTSELDFHLNILNETSEYIEKTKDRSTKRIIKSRIESDTLVVEIEETVNSDSTLSTQRYPLNDFERQLLSIVEVGQPVVFKTLEIPKPPKKEQYLSTPDAVEDDFNWMENCLLFSKYTERKVVLLF